MLTGIASSHMLNSDSNVEEAASMSRYMIEIEYRPGVNGGVTTVYEDAGTCKARAIAHAKSFHADGEYVKRATVWKTADGTLNTVLHSVFTYWTEASRTGLLPAAV